MVHLNSELGAAFAPSGTDSALAGRGLLARKEPVFTGPLALLWLVCCRHLFLTGYKHIINIFWLYYKLFISLSKAIL